MFITLILSLGFIVFYRELIVFLLCSTRMPHSSLFVLNTLAGFEDRSSNLWGIAGKYFLLLWFNRLSCSVCPLREPID